MKLPPPPRRLELACFEIHFAPGANVLSHPFFLIGVIVLFLPQHVSVFLLLLTTLLRLLAGGHDFPLPCSSCIYVVHASPEQEKF